MRWLILLVLAAVAVHAGTNRKGEIVVIKVKSPSFVQNAPIPKKHAYKGEGENVSPAILWDGVPPTARSLALVCDDPDAPRAEPWVHWVVYGIAPKTTGLAEGQAGGAVLGTNDFGTVGWGGPMPPKGHGVHHYNFRVYALDVELTLAPGRKKADLLAAMKGHVVAEGMLTGTYERK